MADIKRDANPLFLREEDLRQAMELMFFAYRDFIAEPDRVLSQYDFGRAHHRVVYFVGRHPSITVKDLLRILEITKQSLSRVLGQLVREGFISQTEGHEDRRQRLLNLTDKGRALEKAMFDIQSQRISNAYRTAGPDAVEGFRQVMLNLMGDPARRRFGGSVDDQAKGTGNR
ncbi:MAG: MarR family transcriptional regulator [Pseudomonadota bacterium]